MAKTLKDLSVGTMLADKDAPNLILRIGGRDLPGYPGTIGIADNIVKLEPGARLRRHDDADVSTRNGEAVLIYRSDSMTKEAFVAMKAALLILQAMDDCEHGITHLIMTTYYTELQEEDMPF